MSGNGQMEAHYVNNGFPYSNTESFMDFFEGLAHFPANVANFGPMHDQESAYWCMNMNLYKFGTSSYGGTTFYPPYGVSDNIPRVDVSRRTWEYPSTISIEAPTAIDAQAVDNALMGVNTIAEECSPNRHNANALEECLPPPEASVVWQDNVDLDNMTYEEILDLGEAVGTQSRGLSEELINLLPTSKYKFADFFARKKFGERCVICQTRYKIGDRQMKLPCKHAYHSECIKKWLSINKICPVCNTEVFGEELKHGQGKC
ncbi:E3 ubiquitin-protein ligase BIG BROTHER [Punica granatum]|uniref:Uncharacterized protein n=2 Tax=Punica granatum TaxID=22663 RepID=A0A2I0HJ02_PUNGR|nr:E3 ubiquitin-protein ligase BIG BROTHER [Punica granatum]PKI31664.1 hypothetical protein CRG98_047948 [Punica granatum]